MRRQIYPTGRLRWRSSDPFEELRPESAAGEGFRSDAFELPVVQPNPFHDGRAVTRIASEEAHAELAGVAVHQQDVVRRAEAQAREHRVLSEREDLRHQDLRVRRRVLAANEVVE